MKHSVSNRPAARRSARESVWRVTNLVRKELIQFVRDWLMTTFILTLPVIQLVLMAQATGSGISELCTVMLDADGSSTSRQLISALENTDELSICHTADHVAETHRLLDQGEAILAVVIPDGFGADLLNGTDVPDVQLIADASSSTSASVAIRGARTAIAAFASDLARQRGIDGQPIVDLRTTVRYNPDFEFRVFSIPAQVGFIIYQVTLTVASIGLARERELGTLEQLMVMPLRRLEMVVGKAIPALVVGGMNFIFMLAVAVFYFQVPMRGSLPLLLTLTLLFILAEIGYGILISGIARTQQQAILFVFVLAMVDMTFSGYMVQIKNLPRFLQAVAQIVPFHHYLTIIRAIMLKGAGLGTLWYHALAMMLIGLFVTVIAIRALNRTLD